MVPDAVAGHARIGVGRVLDAAQSRRCQAGEQVRAGEGEEGTDDGPLDRPLYRPDTAEPLQAGAEEEPQDHGLGLVVPVMGGGDVARAGAAADLFQKFIAHPAGGGLGALSGVAEAWDLAALGDQRYADLRGQVGSLSGASGRAGIEAVVQMSRG